MGPHEVVSFCPRMSNWPVAYPTLSSTGALIMSLTYGFDIKSHEDPFSTAAERALITIEEATVPGAFLVDLFLICMCKEKVRILLLSVMCSETHPIVVPWGQVQTLWASRTEGPRDRYRWSAVRMRDHLYGFPNFPPVRKREERLDSIRLPGSH